MQRKKRKRKLPSTTKTEAELPPTDPLQEGLPAPESVIGKKAFVSPKGRKYVILKTTEVDPSDKPKRKK
jgi:hypothetical protein